MKLLQINIDHKITDAEFAAGRGATKDFGKLIAQQPGLLWKIWIGDSGRSEVGGIYLFEDERAARAFLDGPLFAQVKANPGFKRVDAKLFDVDEECSAITRAPLPVGARA
ncbi:MAG: YdhR family protein [Planctomycetia bacterium]|nr:YdhR family protein [Planctomycetia bacterium]